MTDILKKLNIILRDRKDKNSKESYVSSLYEKGLAYTCEKIDEESKELINALEKESDKRIISEAADLWFHSLVAVSYTHLRAHET